VGRPRGAWVTAWVGGCGATLQAAVQRFALSGVPGRRRTVNVGRDGLRRERAVQLRWHDPKATLAEGIASRGDRRIGPVIEEVWRRGGTFQEWTEHFDLSLWEDAMASRGLSVEGYVTRYRRDDEVV